MQIHRIISTKQNNYINIINMYKGISLYLVSKYCILNLVKFNFKIIYLSDNLIILIGLFCN